MYKILFTLVLGITLFGCGDDPVTNNSNPPGSADTVLLFEKDSIYTGNLYSGRDSVEYTSTISVDTLHASFTICSQNVTGLFASCYTWDTLHSFVPVVYEQSFNLKFAVNSTFTCKTYLELMGSGGSPYCASLKNIRLWHIKRT